MARATILAALSARFGSTRRPDRKGDCVSCLALSLHLMGQQSRLAPVVDASAGRADLDGPSHDQAEWMCRSHTQSPIGIAAGGACEPEPLERSPAVAIEAIATLGRGRPATREGTD